MSIKSSAETLVLLGCRVANLNNHARRFALENFSYRSCALSQHRPFDMLCTGACGWGLMVVMSAAHTLPFCRGLCGGDHAASGVALPLTAPERTGGT